MVESVSIASKILEEFNKCNYSVDTKASNFPFELSRQEPKVLEPVAKEVVDQVMLSIDEGDAALLEKYLRTLRQNADDGLENVAKHSQSRPVSSNGVVTC